MQQLSEQESKSDIDFKLSIMNSIYKLGIAGFCVLLVGCLSREDDSFNRSVSLDILDAFTFQNEKEYAVGDTIYFELSFSRYLPEDGYPNLLDIYETTDEEQFGYSFSFEKFSEQESGFRAVNIDPQFIIAEKNDITNNFYFSDLGTIATLNDAKDTYESRVGIILKEAGVFRFDFENTYFNTPYNYNKVQLGIWHGISDREAVDFEFSVIE